MKVTREKLDAMKLLIEKQGGSGPYRLAVHRQTVRNHGGARAFKRLIAPLQFSSQGPKPYAN